MNKPESAALSCAATLLLVGLLLAAGGGMSMGAPCTLYKPENIATARENIKRHAWAQSILAGYQRRVAAIMEKDRAFIDGMVSDLTPWPTYGQNCPVCVGKQSAMGETGLYKWSLEHPDQVVCKYCGTVYPNPKYPELGSITAPRMGQTFTFYLTQEERAHPEDRSGKYAFRWASWPVHTSWSGIIRARKTGWVVGMILPLAKLYALTDEVKYAQRAAWCLDRLARAYPNWLYHSYNGTFVDLPPGEAAAEMGRHPRAGKFPQEAIITAFPHLVDTNKDGFGELTNGFWGAGRYSAGVGGEGGTLLNCTVAYDLIRDAKYPDGKPVLTEEMRQRITRDLILAGCADLENYPNINNKCGPGRALSGAVGILFQRPEGVRRALEGFEKLLSNCFHFDGFCTESPSYSGMHLGLMRNIPEIVAGYSDPQGYQPKEGPVFKDFDPFRELPRYRLALESMVKMLRPDLKYPVIGDTHSGSGLSPIYAEILAARYGDRYAPLLEAAQGAPLAKKGSEYALWHRRPDLEVPAGPRDLPLRTEYFPGWHVGVLRGGSGKGPNAFYFNGYAMHGHRHYDTLGIIYFALGKELASDRGYIWDDPRNAWTRSTLSHNIVTVDGQNQVSKNRHSTLELFGKAPGVEVIQASANAYAQCPQYRRTCALVQLPEGNTYTVDFFRVQGGKLHQYGFHSQGEMVALEGVKPEPEDGKISWLTNLRTAKEPAPGWRATWDYQGVRMDFWLLTPLQRLVVADAPGWRSYKGDQLHAPPITQILAERSGDNLRSAFVAVMAPYAGEAGLVSAAEPVPPDPPDEQALAVRIKVGDRTDYVISARDSQARKYGPVTLAGQFGFASLDAEGKLRAAYVLAGTELACGEHKLRLEAATTKRRVAKVEGSKIELAQELPAGGIPAGTWFLAGGTGYEVASAKGPVIEVREYPVQPCEEVEILNSAWLEATP